MKLTKRQLKQLIKEELNNVLGETPMPQEPIPGLSECADIQCMTEVAMAVFSGSSIEQIRSLPCVAAAMKCVRDLPYRPQY
jgi:hypothetical protein